MEGIPELNVADLSWWVPYMEECVDGEWNLLVLWHEAIAGDGGLTFIPADGLATRFLN